MQPTNNLPTFVNETAVLEARKLVPDSIRTNKKLDDESVKTYLRMIENIVGVDKYKNARPWEDVRVFLYTCKRTGLDPVMKQIYAVWRWSSALGRGVMSIQTSIDGMRLVAQRTGQYAGQDDIVYEEKDNLPTKATCTIYKIVQGQKVSFTASARFSEYAQYEVKDNVRSLSTFWSSKPFIMLGKCAEALALRKGFPNELAGVYESTEISGDDEVKSVLSELPKPITVGSPQPVPASTVVEQSKLAMDVLSKIQEIRNSGIQGATVPVGQAGQAQ